MSCSFCRKEAQRCYCEAINCRGWIGGEPDTDDEEVEEDEDDGEEEEDAIGKNRTKFEKRKYQKLLNLC